MYGDSVGSLTVYGKYNPTMPNSPLFNRTGTFGRYWLLETFEFKFNSQSDIIVIF